MILGDFGPTTGPTTGPTSGPTTPAREARRRAQTHAMLAALSLAALAGAAAADPADYVSTPAVEYGERELEVRYGSAQGPGGARADAASIALGYGATRSWFTEVYAKFVRAGGSPTRFDAVEWENKLQLTEPGEYPVDLGLLVEIEVPHDRSEGYEVKLGPLLQKDLGLVQVNANAFLERHYRAEAPEVTRLLYQWQAKYRWREAFELGAQGFGEVGKWNDWDPPHERSHIAGPAVFGKVRLGGRQALAWNAGYLFKVSGSAPDHTLRAQVEYEF